MNLSEILRGPSGPVLYMRRPRARKICRASVRGIMLVRTLTTGKAEENEVRELLCACGNRLAAGNDEELVERVLTHSCEVHPQIELTEEQARKLVAAEVSSTEEAKD